MNKVPEMGCHLILDFHNTKIDLNNYDELNSNFTRIIVESGGTIESSSFKQFEPQGLSILYLLSESHFSIHTWPEFGACAIDFYHCGNEARIRMIKAEELLCDYFGWENCTGSMIIDRGTYSYSLIKQDEHTSILYKKHKLVDRQKSVIGENRIYKNEKNEKIFSSNGKLEQVFSSIDGLNELFFEEEKEKSDGSPISNASRRENLSTKRVLVIGCGDLTLSNEILSQGFADEVTVYDSSNGSKEKMSFLVENCLSLKSHFEKEKLIIVNDELILEPEKYCGIVILDDQLRGLKDLKYYLYSNGFVSMIVSSKDEFKDFSLREKLKKVEFCTVSNNINRFLIGRGRYS